MRDLAATRGVVAIYRLFQDEVLNECSEIVSIVIHVVSGPNLARVTMATAVMGDYAKTTISRKNSIRASQSSL